MSAAHGLDYRINTTRLGVGAHVVTLTGEIDLYTAPALDDALCRLANNHAKRVLVDLGGASFIDSTVLGVLLRALRTFAAAGGELILVTDDPRIVRAFTITGLDRQFRISPSLTEAVDALIANVV